MQFIPVASRLLSVKRFSSFGLLTALGLTVSSVIASVSQAQVLVDNNQIEALGPTPAPGFGIARIGGAPAPYPAPGFSPYGAAYGGYGYPSYGGVPGGVRYYPNRFGGTPYAITGGSAYTPYGVPAPYGGGSGYGYGGASYQGYGPTAGLYGGGYPAQPPRSTLVTPYGVTPYGASGGYALGFGTVPQQGAAEPKITIRPPKTSSNPQPTQVSATAPRPTVSTPPAPEPLTSTTERPETSPDSATSASSTSQTASTPPATTPTPAATRPAATTSTSATAPTSTSTTTSTATAGNDTSTTATRPTTSSVPAVPVRPVTSEPAASTQPNATGTAPSSSSSQQSGGTTATRPTSYSTGPLLADPEGQEPAAASDGEGTDNVTQTASLQPPPTPESQGGARLLFASGTAELSDAAKTDLDRMVEKLKADSKVRVQILAYAEGTSDAADRARRQSLDRALAVRNYLFKAGIAVTRMDVRALGFNAGQNDTAPLDRVDIIPQTATN